MIEFIEDVHIYKETATDTLLTSCTSLISQVKPFVDWDLQAEKKAKKIGVTKEELLKEWADKKLKSQIQGTAIHLEKENFYKSQGKITKNNCELVVKWDSVNEKGNKFTPSLQLENSSIYVEKIIFDLYYKIAGQADRIEVIDNKINIYDYKTSEKIDMRGFKSWDGTYQKLSPPLHHIEDCNYFHYSLQLSIYLFLLLRANPNFAPGDLVIEHLIVEDGVIVGSQNYPVEYLKKEAHTLLNHFKNKK